MAMASTPVLEVDAQLSALELNVQARRSSKDSVQRCRSSARTQQAVTVHALARALLPAYLAGHGEAATTFGVFAAAA
jgi:hypothetical protein